MTRIGIISALQSETICLSCNKLKPGVAYDINERMTLVLSGMGENNVRQALDSLFLQQVDGLISFGTAGALANELRSGDILLPEKILDSSGKVHLVSSAWHDKVSQQLANSPTIVHNGDLLTSTNIIADADSKKVLAKKTGALAVDMESALITQIAHSQQLPTITLRVIIDESTTCIPEKILKNTNAYGQANIPAILASILQNPLLVRDLLTLASAFEKAKKTMRWIGNHADKLSLPNSQG